MLVVRMRNEVVSLPLITAATRVAPAVGTPGYPATGHLYMWPRRLLGPRKVPRTLTAMEKVSVRRCSVLWARVSIRLHVHAKAIVLRPENAHPAYLPA